MDANTNYLEDHHKKLVNMYCQAPINEFYRPRLTITRGGAELIIPVREKFFHAGGGVHGSVYFKAADDAAYFAANSLVRDVFILTVSFNLHIIRPVNEGEIRAVGSVIQMSPSIIIAQAVLFNSKGKEIGMGTGNFAKSKIALDPQIGYRL